MQILRTSYLRIGPHSSRPRMNEARGASPPLEQGEASQWIGWLAAFCEVGIDALLVQDAIEASRRHQVSYWDGAIIAAATRAGVSTLFTEDLSHLQNYDGVRAVNPFLPR